MVTKRRDNKFKIVDTPQKSIAWEDDAERLILYADIMGFSHRVNRNNHLKLKNDLLRFKQSWDAKSTPLRKGGIILEVCNFPIQS